MLWSAGTNQVLSGTWIPRRASPACTSVALSSAAAALALTSGVADDDMPDAADQQQHHAGDGVDAHTEPRRCTAHECGTQGGSKRQPKRRSTRRQSPSGQEAPVRCERTECERRWTVSRTEPSAFSGGTPMAVMTEDALSWPS